MKKKQITIITVIAVLGFAYADSTENWSRTFGGDDDEWAYAVDMAEDGGYILAGYTSSYGSGDSDGYIVKLNSAGEPEWDNTFGGTERDWIYSIKTVPEDGYIAVGYTKSDGAGERDLWVIKIDSDGEPEWEKTFGGRMDDYAKGIELNGSGYVVVGATESYGAGNGDLWVIALSADGEKIWDKTYGGSEFDEGRSIQVLSNGGFILSGGTFSEGAGNRDGWVLRLDSAGNLTWSETFGGENADFLRCVLQADDGSFYAAGYTILDCHPDKDAWIVRIDKSGNQLWDDTYGGRGEDYTGFLQYSQDGGFYIGVNTYSYGKGDEDSFVIKIDEDGRPDVINFFGDEGYDGLSYILKLTEGGYLFCGGTGSYNTGNYDFWIVKSE